MVFTVHSYKKQVENIFSNLVLKFFENCRFDKFQNNTFDVFRSGVKNVSTFDLFYPVEIHASLKIHTKSI